MVGDIKGMDKQRYDLSIHLALYIYLCIRHIFFYFLFFYYVIEKRKAPCQKMRFLTASVFIINAIECFLAFVVCVFIIYALNMLFYLTGQNIAHSKFCIFLSEFYISILHKKINVIFQCGYMFEKNIWIR